MLQMTAKIQNLKKSVLKMSDLEFNDLAIEIFELQYELNPVYREFVSNLPRDIHKITDWSMIPCLPISFFKSHDILLKGLEKNLKFQSSGTTGQVRSKKYLPDPDFYKRISSKGFLNQFGKIKDYSLFALLPSYIENSESSLIYMIQHFINNSDQEFGGFYKDNFEDLIKDVVEAKSKGKKIMLWGVSFALLDLVENHNVDLRDVMIFETGGMKGRKEEITREELHKAIKSESNASQIFSEYGMTELMSQAYTSGGQKFSSPKWMKVQSMELNDPFQKEKQGRIGTLNIIDLANIETCAFIATEDLARVYKNETFEVLGRKDNAEIRGCNLMMA